MIKKIYNKYKEDLIKIPEDIKHKETFKRQIPNMLTISRLFGPMFIIPFAFSGYLKTAAILTCLFSATDGLDGYFARKYDCTSELGRDLDPIVDKLFAGQLIIPFIISNPILLINMALEGTIAYTNTQSKIKSNDPRSTKLGKVKTAALYSLLIANYASIGIAIDPEMISVLFGTTVALQTLTSVQYKLIDMKKDKNKTVKIKPEEIEEYVEEEKEEEKEIVEEFKKQYSLEDLINERESLRFFEEDMDLLNLENIEYQKQHILKP